MTIRILISCANCHVWSVATILPPRPRISDTPIRASQNLLPALGLSRTIALWSRYVGDVTENNTKPMSADGGGRLTQFLSRWRSFRFPGITRRAPRSSRRHFGFSGEW